MTNTTKIIDTYVYQNDTFKDLRNKAEKSIDVHKEIGEIVDKSNKIIRDVFTKFISKRVKLGIYLLKPYYVDMRKEKKEKKEKIVIPKDKKYKNKDWHYDELCINNTGFSLLPPYGVNSISILDGNSDDKQYYLSILEDKRIMSRLKSILPEDRLGILNSVLKDIELLKYDCVFTKEKTLKFNKIKRDSGIFKKEKNKTKYIILKLGNGVCECALSDIKTFSYYGRNMDLTCLNIDDALILEQVSDEVSVCLDECYDRVIKKKEVLVEYLNTLEDRLHKELIIMALRNNK